MNSDEQAMLKKAIDHLHTWTSGDLRFDEHIRPVKYVFAPDGRLVVPVMVAMLQATEMVVHVPRADETAMELLVSPLELDEDGPEGGLADRWRIYHGDPPDVHWASLTVDLARFHGMVMDGEAIQQPNPFAPLEPAICGELNRDHVEKVRAALVKTLDVDTEEPRVVGVDPRGIDVRARFDVVRLAFDHVLDEGDDIRSTVIDLIS
ncbi:MAG: DUF2470 domain-containing protein [Phycisphaerales bacterium]|nr:DUF2470 domain-containing protein [Phycisphaerales bacterium]|tara:strand:- start:3092 stop:3709 length:618 start_codon:yes stop_codon:yes gene_type:complete